MKQVGMFLLFLLLLFLSIIYILYLCVTLPYILSRPLHQTSWVENILEGRKEVDRVIFRDEDEKSGYVFIVIIVIIIIIIIIIIYHLYIVSLCYSSLYCFSSFAPNFG